MRELKTQPSSLKTIPTDPVPFGAVMGILYRMQIVIIPNPEKHDAVAASHELANFLKGKANVHVIANPSREIIQRLSPDLVVALGGDGSILRVAHLVAGMHTIVAGINFGKLGYLAAFSQQEFCESAAAILRGDLPTVDRLMIEGAIYDLAEPGKMESPAALLGRAPKFSFPALNDVVVNAGEPFRMIQLQVRIDNEETATFRGDGLIVATSSGSTGYNLSAGGPLLAPDVHALILTPICAHSLSFRPVVVSDSATIAIYPVNVNSGTSISFDGQVSEKLSAHQCVVIRRYSVPVRLVENPRMTHWQTLGSKLQWAQGPRGM